MASIFKRKSGSSASPRSGFGTLSGSSPSPRLSMEGVVPDGSAKSALSRRGPRIPFLIIGIVVGLIVLGAVGYFALSFTQAFKVTSLDIPATEHLDADSIARLADVSENTTLLNVDVSHIEEGLLRNPWVKSVKVIREFPDKLKIEVTERRVGAIVLMNTGNLAWNLGEDTVWIEPAKIPSAEGESSTSAALAYATELEALLIYDVPTSVAPKAGEAVQEGTVASVSLYMTGFSEEFASQIVSFSASSDQAIACTLSSGVTISLGEPTEIEAKERVINELLAQYPDQVTYINVRVPSRPSFRKVGTETVQAGTGATG